MGAKVQTFVDNNPPQCDAQTLNLYTDEINNIISSTGIALSTGDGSQAAKAVSEYSAGGDFYTDSGAANAYVLSAVGSKEAPTQYFVGMRVRFQPGNNNTGASTVNVNSLGLQSIKLSDGTTDPRQDNISANATVTLVYDGINFLLIDAGAPIDNTISLFIETVADQDYLIDLALNIPYNISSAIIATTSGTCDFDLKVNGVSINPFVGVSTTPQTANFSPSEVVAANQSVSATVTNNSAATGLFLKLLVDGVI